MRLTVLGATGRTGSHVVRQARERGCDVTALARHPSAMPPTDGRVKLVAGDCTDPAAVAESVESADAVISTLGIGSSRQPTTIYSAGISNVLAAAPAGCVTAAVSAAPVGPWDGEPFLQRRVVLPLLWRALRASYADMRRMEDILAGADLPWVVLRPPRLTDGAAKGSYRLGVEALPAGGRRIACADLATALLDSVGDEDRQRRAWWVASG